MLEAGFAKTGIEPPSELHLIGTYARKPRLGLRVRDPLMARALALRKGERRVVVVACDLLCVSEELHLAVAGALGLEPEEILLAGTHTHSSFGGFFGSPATAPMLGAHRPVVFRFLVERLAGLVGEALGDLAPARALAGGVEVAGLTDSRRQAGGPYDDRVVLLRLVREGRRPIDLFSSSGHPVVVSERELNTVSADYPGEVCRELDRRGSDALFLSAALGGISILFPEFEMGLERHMELLRGLLVRGHARAVEALRPVDPDAALEVDLFHLQHGPHQSRIFEGFGPMGRLADALLQPVLGKLVRAGEQALPLPRGVPMHLVRLDDFCLVGSAAELGVSVVLAIRSAAGRAGIRNTLVASMADGYAGYVHLGPVYGRWPERGYRFLALYENALAMFGHDLGDRIAAAVASRLG